jgi:hypothetical protein
MEHFILGYRSLMPSILLLIATHSLYAYKYRQCFAALSTA